MRKQMTLLVAALALGQSASALAQVPDYFSAEGNKEYLAVVRAMESTLPEKDKGEAAGYMMLLQPYGLLDIHPTKFNSVDSKQQFANFNLGLMAMAILKLGENQTKNLAALTICADAVCRNKRIGAIEAFLGNSEEHADVFDNYPDLDVVQQLSEQLYRINNAFIAPAETMVYEPSEEAGFVPSASPTKHASLDELPDIQTYSEATEQLRATMNRYKVNAIARLEDGAINIIFQGFADNHWGVVFNGEGVAVPEPGDINNLGYEYYDVEKISANAFYYQTN
jgi:hypothetical protein